MRKSILILGVLILGLVLFLALVLASTGVLSIWWVILILLLDGFCFPLLIVLGSKYKANYNKKSTSWDLSLDEKLKDEDDRITDAEAETEVKE